MNLIKGDLFSTDANVIAHGCNCQGGFGSGIAGAIALRWPEVRAAYLSKHFHPGWSLGEFQVVPVNDKDLIVANLATQQFYGKSSKIYVSYGAIETSLTNLFDWLSYEGLSGKVAVPFLGCGLANGDWNIVRPILEKVSNQYPNITLMVYYL